MTISGIKSRPSTAAIKLASQECDASAVRFKYTNDTLYLTDLDSATRAGAWSGELEIILS